MRGGSAINDSKEEERKTEVVSKDKAVVAAVKALRALPAIALAQVETMRLLFEVSEDAIKKATKENDDFGDVDVDALTTEEQAAVRLSVLASNQYSLLPLNSVPPKEESVLREFLIYDFAEPDNEALYYSLVRKLSPSELQWVFLATDTATRTKSVVVKWMPPEEARRTGTDIRKEVSVWERLAKAGLEHSPFRSGAYRGWMGQEVALFELLTPLRLVDRADVFRVGIEVLDQLELVHAFGVYSDLKPENVLQGAKDGRAHVIDMADVSTKPQAYGYVRNVRSAPWALQRGPSMTTTAKWDLLEWVRLLRGFELRFDARLNKKDDDYHPTAEELDGLQGGLSELWIYLNLFSETDVTKEVYAGLRLACGAFLKMNRRIEESLNRMAEKRQQRDKLEESANPDKKQLAAVRAEMGFLVNEHMQLGYSSVASLVAAGTDDRSASEHSSSAARS